MNCLSAFRPSRIHVFDPFSAEQGEKTYKAHYETIDKMTIWRNFSEVKTLLFFLLQLEL